VADENQGTIGDDLPNDSSQVKAELIDVVRLLGPRARPTVATLVPEHDAVAGSLECPPLEHPAAQAQRIAVAEHDSGGSCTLGQTLWRVFGLVDLDVQRHTVRSQDDDFGSGLVVIGISGVQCLRGQACAGQALGGNTRGTGSRRSGHPDTESDETVSTIPAHCWPPT